MKKIFRRTARRGLTIKGVAIGPNRLGYVTIKTATGKLLTNIPVNGGPVSIGDRVIVSYATGNPIATPEFIYDPDESQPLDEAPYIAARSSALADELPEDPVVNPSQDVDYGCATGSSWELEPYGQPSQKGVPTRVIFATNQWQYGYGVVLWDNCNMTDRSTFGSDHVTIKRSGKYLISSMQCWQQEGQYAPFTGAFTIEIQKNGSTIARQTSYPNGSGTMRQHNNVSVISDCTLGDTISLVITNGVNPYNIGGWILPDFTYQQLRLQLIPGTQPLGS